MNTAIFSDCGSYRYVLKRNIPQSVRWVKPCLFIMLNPSVANAEENDPTITRCINFAKSWLATELTVINLFALVSTDSKELLKHKNPIGDLNDEYIKKEIERHAKIGTIVCAWGSFKGIEERVNYIKSFDVDLKALHINKDGNPKHPLYVASNTELVDFS